MWKYYDTPHKLHNAGAGSACPCILPQFLPLTLWICVPFSSLSLSTFCSQKVAKTSGTSFASRSRLLLVSYHVTSLIRLLLIARVCRSNLGNKRTRFTHYRHRMAHTLRHFCSNSSIGTDTRCCSTPCRFCFENYTCTRFVVTVGVGSARSKDIVCGCDGKWLLQKSRFVVALRRVRPRT